MTPLIAMPGPWLPEATPVRDAEAPALLPQLPVLTQLLRHARRLDDAADWRAGVLSAAGMDPSLPPIAVAAAAVPAAAGAALCFAAPLHLVAGMSRVHLPAGGWLSPAPDEEAAWRDAFDAEFGSSGLRLHVAAPGGGWVLESPFAQGAREAPPAALVGGTLARAPAASPDEKALRRLIAECELWLSAHPLNRAREARGEPVMNTLWFWGGGRQQQVGRPQGLCSVIADGAADAWLAGLAALAGSALERESGFDAALQRAHSAAAVAPQPAHPAAADAGQGKGDRRHAVFVPLPAAGAPTAQYWQQLEDAWLAPAWRAWQSGHLRTLRLQVGRTAWQLPGRGWFGRLLSSRAPWWQLTGEARA